MKEIIARTQKEWQKLRRILAPRGEKLPRRLKSGTLAAALIPARGEHAEILGSYAIWNDKTDTDHLFIEWRRVADKKPAPSVAFLDDKGGPARFLKVYNPDAP